MPTEADYPPGASRIVRLVFKHPDAREFAMYANENGEVLVQNEGDEWARVFTIDSATLVGGSNGEPEPDAIVRVNLPESLAIRAAGIYSHFRECEVGLPACPVCSVIRRRCERILGALFPEGVQAEFVSDAGAFDAVIRMAQLHSAAVARISRTRLELTQLAIELEQHPERFLHQNVVADRIRAVLGSGASGTGRSTSPTEEKRV